MECGMDPDEHRFVNDLVQRHAGGERSAVLLVLLDELAKAYLDSQEPAKVPVLGRLPLDDGPSSPEAVQAAKAGLALLVLASRLEGMGLRPARLPDGLQVGLPYDPVADVLASLHCRIDAGLAGFHLGVSADRTWPASQGRALQDRCAAWDARPRCLRSLPWQPLDGALLRPRLAGWIPLGEPDALPGLLARVLDEVEDFYRLLGQQR
jgi:hypothetical protein